MKNIVEAWLARSNQNESLSANAFELLRKTIESRADVLLPLSLKIAARDQGPLAKAMREIVDRSNNLDLLQKLAQAVPLRTVNLVTFAPVLERRILFLLSTTSGGFARTGSKELLAKHSNNLAVRLIDVDAIETALPFSEAAAQIYEELADRQPGKFLSELAAALNTQALILSKNGNLEKAIEKADEVVEIYRSLIQNGAPFPLFRENLALTLKSRSDRLSLSGPPRLPQALRDAEESVSIYRSLEANPSHSPGLAASLVSFANRLLAAGKPAEALEKAEAAKTIYDFLQARDRDEYLPALAACLRSVVDCRLANQLWKQALEAANKALDISDLLRKQNPRLFDEDHLFMEAKIAAIQPHLRP